MNIDFFTGDKKAFWALFLLILLVYVPGLFVPLMDNDSAHHADIALHMYLSGNYAFLIDNGKPYLDKPHLLFWLAAFSYKIFGVTTFAYKLPSFLFTLLGTYATYRLGTLLYTKAVGRLAAIILSTACAYILANNDVRMDAILAASIIFATWQLVEYIKFNKWINLILSALGLALGFATKGLIGAVVPAVAIFFYVVYERNWKMIFHWKWLILILFFFIFISPVLYSYYLQFDLHPEIEVRGMKNNSGVEFILWEQNFERMKGEGFTKHVNNDYFFFFHTFLWAFLPWSLLAGIAVFSQSKNVVQARFEPKRIAEFLTLGALAFFMILFSFSKFKLPHYLNCLFPFFAILLAGYLYERQENSKRFKLFWGIQLFVLFVTVLLAFILLLWVFPVHSGLVIVVAAILFILWLSILFLRKVSLTSRVISWTVLGSVFTFFTLNANFYPQLLTYQAGNELALISKKHSIPTRSIYAYRLKDVSYSFDFYTAYLHENITLDAIKEARSKGRKLWVLTDSPGKLSLRDNAVSVKRIFEHIDFRITRLKPKFLNPATRREACKSLYLIEL